MAYELVYTPIDALTTSVTGYTGTPVDVVVPETADGGRTVVSIGVGAFNGCASLSSITLPDGLTSIELVAFELCTNLVSITSTDSLTSIGQNAFNSCSSLASITVLTGLTSIGDGAFYGCSSLASITLSNGLASIGDAAFFGCTSLASIYFLGNKPTLGALCFDNGGETGAPIPATAYILTSATGWPTPPTGVGDPAIPTAYFHATATVVTAPATISGLDYLEGKTVAILRDGMVEASKVVTDGAITITKVGTRIVYGLPYTSTLAPMYVEPQSQFVQPVGKVKALFRAVLRFKDTLSCKVGQTLQRLENVDFRKDTDGLDKQVELFSGEKKVNITNRYELLHTCYIVQDKPLPITVIAMVPWCEVHGE